MKIWFRIGPDRGNEQDGPQPPERYSSAHSTVRFLDPFTLLALTKEGNICEGSRFSGARLSQAQPLAPTPLLSRQHRAKSSAKLGESEQLSDISNRFWPKYRSYRKQTIKPCLTGSRIAHMCNSRLPLRRCFKHSTRFWSSRSYRKQTIKPLLPGSRIAHFWISAHSRTLFVPAVAGALRPPPASWRTSAIPDVCYPCRGDSHEWVTSIASRVI